MDRQIKTAEDLLRIREARVLRVPAIVRIVFGLFGVGVALTTPMPTTARLVVGFLVSGTIAADLYFLVLLRDVRNVVLVGYAGAAIDILNIALYPFITYQIIAQYSMPPASISKTFSVVVVCSTFMVINSLALRPVYPLIVTAGSVLVHVALLVIAIVDPRTVWATSDRELVTGPATSVSLFINEAIFLLS